MSTTIPVVSALSERQAAATRRSDFPSRFPKDARSLGENFSVEENSSRVLSLIGGVTKAYPIHECPDLHSTATLLSSPRARQCGSSKSILIIFIALALGSANAAEFYVSPTGLSTNSGSIASPWDLQTALADNSQPANKNFSAKPGDTIWLRGGTYGTGGSTLFSCRLRGTEGKQMILRGCAGERAIIDGGISGDGSWTTFWGFEITNSSPLRKVQAAYRPAGINMIGRGLKAVNMIIHDVGHPGIGFWSGVGDSGEIYGTIMWGNGLYDLSDPRFPDGWTRGSGIYAQNQTGTRIISDVVSFKQFTTGFKIYTEGGWANGFVVEGNVTFDNNDSTLFAAAKTNPIQDISWLNNFSYMDKLDARSPPRLGYYSQDMIRATIRGNYFVNGSAAAGALIIHKWQDLTVTNNDFISQLQANPAVLVTLDSPAVTGVQVWNQNRYYGGSPTNQFMLDGLYKTLAQWKAATGFDAASSYSATGPSKNHVVVRPNKYESGRAHIIAYNWEDLDHISVDISSAGLLHGDRFSIYDAQKILGPPLLKEVYHGQLVSLPMNLTAITPLIGAENITHFDPSTHTDKKFNVFIVIKNTSQPGLTPMPTVASAIDTSTSTPTISGTATPGATIRIYDNNVLIASVSANSASGWSWTASPPLAAGTHHISVSAEGGGLYESARTVSLTVVSDGSSGKVGMDSTSGDGCGLGSGIGYLLLAIGMLVRVNNVQSSRRKRESGSMTTTWR